MLDDRRVPISFFYIQIISMVAHQPHRLWTSWTHGLDERPRARGAFRGLSGGGDFFCRHFKTGKICAQHRTKISKAVRNHTEHFFWKRCGKDTWKRYIKRNTSRRKRYKKIWKRCAMWKENKSKTINKNQIKRPLQHWKKTWENKDNENWGWVLPWHQYRPVSLKDCWKVA